MKINFIKFAKEERAKKKYVLIILLLLKEISLVTIYALHLLDFFAYISFSDLFIKLCFIQQSENTFEPSLMNVPLSKNKCKVIKNDIKIPRPALFDPNAFNNEN